VYNTAPVGRDLDIQCLWAYHEQLWTDAQFSIWKYMHTDRFKTCGFFQPQIWVVWACGGSCHGAKSRPCRHKSADLYRARGAATGNGTLRVSYRMNWNDFCFYLSNKNTYCDRTELMDRFPYLEWNVSHNYGDIFRQGWILRKYWKRFSIFYQKKINSH
jgi:hypothetical protein